MGDKPGNPETKKEIYTYDAPWNAYALSWCRRKDPSAKFKLAIGSYIEEYSNEIHIVQLMQDSGGNGVFKKLAKLDHPYPPTKIMWSPPKSSSTGLDKDLLATSGDYLRIWGVDRDNRTEMKALLNNNKHTEYCAPLTAFDWNEADTNMIGTCSIDTTVTIWDLGSMAPKTQLIAHDKEVYDIAFVPDDTNIFATAGADGSVRLFDLRSLEHSTILYESNGLSPLMRTSWNKQDPNYLATLSTDSNKVTLLDLRSPSIPVCELTGHRGATNAACWAPQSEHHIATCADDKQALIWDVSMKNANKIEIEDPVLAYTAGAEINNMIWCKSHEDWISISYSSHVQILKV